MPHRAQTGERVAGWTGEALNADDVEGIDWLLEELEGELVHRLAKAPDR